MRVGLLEDDIATQEMLVLALQDEGHTVIVYDGAEACLDALNVKETRQLPLPLDLLIVDWRLAGPISGIEVIQQVRANPRLHELPIILTTAVALNDSEELRNLQTQAVLLEKPFSVDEMSALIKQLSQPPLP
ncbi:MAG: response regulator [Ktedonobacteraceae bacterium]|nr:response regulator [Ktedonobacteraceae bacterium]